jgi:hypothetical protein
MANAKITVIFDSARLAAIRQFSEKGAPDIEAVLTEQLNKTYAKTVPTPVRQYIEQALPVSKASPVPKAAPIPKASPLSKAAPITAENSVPKPKLKPETGA